MRSLRSNVQYLTFSAVALTVMACGGGGGGTTTTPVTPPSNSAPIVSTANGNQTAIVGTNFEYDATQNNTTFTDADGDALTITVSFAPNANGFSNNNGVISGTPTDDIVVTVTITASDGNGGSILSLIHI